jgi:hypothetical protein
VRRTLYLASAFSAAFGVPKGKVALLELAQELVALIHVADTQLSLEGDLIAQREIHARLRHLRGELENALRDAFGQACWYFNGQSHDVLPSHGLSALASDICDMVFHAAPVVHSELVNRDALSSNSAKAQRLLLHRMVLHGTLPNLGFTGYPSEAGVYFTTLVELGLHRTDGETARFVAPKGNSDRRNAKNLVLMWTAVQRKLKDASGPVALDEIYSLLRSAPFGIKEGLLPIFALAFFLTYRSEIGLYVEGNFVTQLDDAGTDEWLQDPTRIAWQWVHINARARQLLERLAVRLERDVGRKVTADPLDSARALVALILGLPDWTRRTQRLSQSTRRVRDVLLRASDPVKVIFIDLPEVLEAASDSDLLLERLGAAIDELQRAYPAEIAKIRQHLLSALDHAADHAILRRRAGVVQGISGDFRLDAFAGRLQLFDAQDSHVEGLVSLVTSKPPKEFSDHDMDAAFMQLAKLALEFRRVEALAEVKGRLAGRRALAVVFGTGSTVSGSFDVAIEDDAFVDALANELIDRITSGAVRREVLLAALAEAGTRALELRPIGEN